MGNAAERPAQHPAALTGTDIALQPITQHLPPWLLGEGSDAGPEFQNNGGEMKGVPVLDFQRGDWVARVPLHPSSLGLAWSGHTLLLEDLDVTQVEGGTLAARGTHSLPHTHTWAPDTPGLHIPPPALGCRHQLPEIAPGGPSHPLLSTPTVYSSGRFLSAPTLLWLTTDYRWSSDPSAYSQGPP